MKKSLLFIPVLFLLLTSCGTQKELSAEQIYEIAAPSTVEITAESSSLKSTGTGFFDDENGTVITNFHVIDGASEAYITRSDGGKYDVLKVVGFSKELDVAILSTSCKNSTPLKKREEPVKTGEPVYALGSSLGLTDTFSEGIISNESRDIDGLKFIQTTAPISHGNSGGPLLDKYGNVVGITSAGFSSGQNLNLAIPVSEISKVERNVNLSMEKFYLQNSPFEELFEYLESYGEYKNLFSIDRFSIEQNTIPPFSSVGESFSVEYRINKNSEELKLSIFTKSTPAQEYPDVSLDISIEKNSSNCRLWGLYCDEEHQTGLMDASVTDYPVSMLSNRTNQVPFSIEVMLEEYAISTDQEQLFDIMLQQAVSDIINSFDAWLEQRGLSCRASDFGFSMQ